MLVPLVLLLASVPQAVVHEVNASDWPGHQGEVSIAVDPGTPERVVAASMDLEDGRLLVMASADSGLTWHRTQIPVSPGAAYDADPMVDFDSRGRAFLAHIPVATGNHPVGIEVARSLDGGRTWAPSVRLSHHYDRDDKVALEVDDHESSPYRDFVYVAWKWPSGGVWFSRSLDSGLRFEEPRAIDSPRVTGLDMAVDGSGRLYLALYDHGGASIRVYRSDDGGLSFSQSARVSPVRAGWYSAQPSHCRRLSLTHASIDVGTTPSGPSGEVLYASWADYVNGLDLESCSDLCSLDSPCRTEVYFSLSRDQGRTWTEPIGFAEGDSDRFFSWVSADSNAVYLAYRDTRAAESRLGTDVFVQRSNDCGLSFEPAVRLSSASSFAVSADFQYGDYQGLDAVSGNAFAAWADYRPGKPSEIYVGRASFASGSGFRASVGIDTVDLSYRFEGPEDVLAELSVYAISRYDGSSRTLLRETRRLVPGEEISLALARKDLEGGSKLHAEVVAETAPLSKLTVWVDDLLQGRSVGCR